MRHLPLFLIGLLLLIIAGCHHPKPADTFDYAEPAILTGKVLHPEFYPKTREITVVLPFIDERQPQKYVAPIREDGTFSLVLFPYTFRDGSIQTFVDRFVIAPGDSLHVELDFADLTYTHFSAPVTMTISPYSCFSIMVTAGRPNSKLGKMTSYIRKKRL